MRLTIQALGLELDLTFGIATDAIDDEPADSGYTTSTFLGFVPAHPVPEEVTTPQHCPSWDEPEE